MGAEMASNPNEKLKSAEQTRERFSRLGVGRNVERPKAAKTAILRLLAYLLPYKKELILVSFLVVVYTLLGLVGPYLLGHIIDSAIAKPDPASLTSLGAALAGVYVFYNLTTFATNWIMARVSQLALGDLRLKVFRHAQSLPMRFFDTNPAGRLMSHLTNDIDAINQAVSQNIVALFASGLSIIGIITSMFILNAYLAVAALIVVPIFAWFTQFVAKYTIKGFRGLQKDLGDLNSVVEETISGQKVINAYQRNESALREFDERNERVFRSSVAANVYALSLMPITNQLGNLFIIVLAALGGWLALRDLVTVGTIAAFISYGNNFLSPVRQIANQYNSLQAALAGAERVFDILDTPGEFAQEQFAKQVGKLRGDVVFDKVRFSYLPDRPVINDFSLNVKAGQTIALVGPTGAGKTTIINLLTRFYEVDSGAIKVDGIDIRELRKQDLRRNLGLVLQDTFLFAENVLENIRFGNPEASDEECVNAARQAEADYFIQQLPEGYQTNLVERAANLSGGQKQMLSIARAILADPSILILDEATSSVDTRTEVRIQQSLLALMRGRTSFVIAHRLSTIREADLVVVIDNGGIVEQGTHAELMERKGFFYNLTMSQYKGNEI